MPSCAMPASDLQGTQNWLHLGVQSYNLWWQGLVDGIANDDQTGLTAEQQGQRKARRFGELAWPGDSSSASTAASATSSWHSGRGLAQCTGQQLLEAPRAAALAQALLDCACYGNMLQQPNCHGSCMRHNTAKSFVLMVQHPQLPPLQHVSAVPAIPSNRPGRPS